MRHPGNPGDGWRLIRSPYNSRSLGTIALRHSASYICPLFCTSPRAACIQVSLYRPMYHEKCVNDSSDCFEHPNTKKLVCSWEYGRKSLLPSSGRTWYALRYKLSVRYNFMDEKKNGPRRSRVPGYSSFTRVPGYSPTIA